MNIKSSAFPPSKQPKIASQVHQLLAARVKKNEIQNEIIIRDWKSNDTHELKKLQSQWFPLTYPQSFYHKIEQGQSICLVAETTICVQVNGEQKQICIIVGALVYTFIDSQNQLKSKGWFKGIFNQSRDSIYIMTLGVIDEYRSSGLAQRLLKEIFNISERNIEIKFIYLHVVVYNERAIRFYQKNGFKILQKYSDYYHIFSLEYEGYLVGAFVNGGQPRQGWLSCIKRLIWKSTEQS